MKSKLNQIFSEADLVPDVTLSEDIDWMEKQRIAAGKPLLIKPE
jgi:hypothetical protein